MNKKMKILIVIGISICIVFILLLLYQKMERYEKVEIGKIASVNSTLTGKRPTYNNPVIPQGFKAVNDETTWEISHGGVKDWNRGLVIEDHQGNQFVWVPVKDKVGKDGINQNDKMQYKKWYIYESEDAILEEEKGYIESLVGETITNLQITFQDIKEDTLPKGVASEEDQIKKYGGFYIARYEAGISDEDLRELYHLADNFKSYTVTDANNQVHYLPVSKKNTTLYNFIDYQNAKTVAEKMYQMESVKSGLMTGKQFDTIMLWAKQSGYDLENAKAWGNFQDTVNVFYQDRYASYLRKVSQDWKIKDYGEKINEKRVFTSPGGLSIAKMNNIYDIAGNVFELTTDLYKGKTPLVRGGSAAYNGSKGSPHSAISYSFGDSLHYVIGFRVVLYVI